MIDLWPESFSEGTQIGLIGIITGIFIVLTTRLIHPVLQSTWQRFTSLQASDRDQGFVQSNSELIQTAVAITALYVGARLLPERDWSHTLEIWIGLTLTILTALLASRLFKTVFDRYVLNAVVRSGRKLNSEFFILIRWLVNLAIGLVALLLFAQTHQINVLGLLASLGIGGLAVAFAAQKTLEQVLGGIVIYLDRPFGIDDYIGLPDGTFGRVESIGLRSTKIRTSGKGTLTIVPNSALTQVNIENFTGAKKVMSLLQLTFATPTSSEEQALIRQVILDSTRGIFGIDARSTEVVFKPQPHATLAGMVQAQVTFFILGSGDSSMALRRRLLDLATQTLSQRLQDCGVEFEVGEPTIYVDSPITI